MHHTVPDISSLFFKTLKCIDAEAATMRDGSPTGLLWYGAHARPNQKKPQSEPRWSSRLAEMLSAAGYPARSEVTYPGLMPGKRSRCDVVVGLHSGAKLWIEIKGAWKEYWGKNDYIYRSYLLHPLVPGLDPKTHTVPLDMRKLAALGKADADHVGMLLIGFDSHARPMDADVEQLVRLSGLGIAPWTAAWAQWDDVRRPGCRVGCWYWQRPVA